MNRHELERLRKDVVLYQNIITKYGDMMTRTYSPASNKGSQGEEDDILKELLPDNEGVYVDIGAGEPKQCSNTWAFYERGWRGLLVEPLFLYWPAILEHRAGDFLSAAAIRNYNGCTMLRVQGTVSSCMMNWRIDEYSRLMVPCETTATLLAKFPAVREACQLCSIDVEGAEKEVLESIDWATFHPEVFVVEFLEYDPHKLGADLSGQWVEILEAQAYAEVARTVLNIIYQKKHETPTDPAVPSA